jgi:hypothetical protein
MRRYSLTALVALAAIFSSCTLGLGSAAKLDSDDLAEFQGAYMTTFDILNGSFLSSDRALTPFNGTPASSSSKATVPMWTNTTYSLPTNSGDVTTGSRTNYPEPGQTSSWTVRNEGSNRYYIEVTTSFPTYDARSKQQEFYYITSTNDIWDFNDPICDNLGVPNAAYRAKNELTFRDGSIQKETIVEVSSRFEAFDTAGSLDYPDAFVPKSDPGATWSSVVVYTRTYTDSPSFSFWYGNRVRTIVGIRYYTEHLTNGNTNLEGSTLVFEKAITTVFSEGGDFLNAYSSLFLPYVANSPNQAFLALSVVRQSILYDYDNALAKVDYDSAVRDTRTKTRVVNIGTQQDNYITRINDEAADITNAYATLWIPTGEDSAIVNLGDSTTVDVKTSNLVVTTNDSAPIQIIGNTFDPLNDLSDLYVSVDMGAPTNSPASTDIAGDLIGTGDVKVFNGHQGITLPGNDYAFHDKGTIQAWVYISIPTNFGGIVHSGMQADFLDEIWSLQFWGNNNTPCFSLSSQSPYKFDYVTSSQRLNNNKWYYLVSTWDLAANSMKIYVDGVLKGSSGFSNVKVNSTFETDSPVVIGSQFYDASELLSGYYGVNGKINGVLIDHSVWTAAEIKAFYDANKAKTASW